MREIASTVVGSSPRTLGIVVLVAAVAVGGVALALVATPSVERIDAEFGTVNDTHTEIRADLLVDAPVGTGPVDGSADYTVAMNDVVVAGGDEDGLSLEPGQSSVSTSTHMSNDRVPAWWVTHVDNDERTDVVVDATITTPVPGWDAAVSDHRTVETDVLGSLESNETRPIDADLALVDDPVLYVTATRAEWGAVDENRTELEVDTDAYNPTAFDASVRELSYTVRLNDVVVGDGETSRNDTLEAENETTLDATVDVENDALEEWWVTHLENDQVSTLEIVFEVRIELPTGGTVTVDVEPFPDATIETDLFDDESDDGDG